MPRTVIDGPDGSIEVDVRGDGHAVVMVPSLGRGAADFDDLADRVAASGRRAICPEPRGFGASSGSLDGLTMDDLAADVAAVVDTVADGRPSTLLGHAFGNRVVRHTATRHPDRTESVILVACGGRVPPEPEHAAALRAVFDPTLDADAHLDAVRTAFFAPGNDAAVWSDGWDGDAAAAQAGATAATDPSVWWEAGQADVLVLQPEQDVIALPENAADIARALGHRATVLSIPGAGHATLPEQPDEIARTILTWLDLRGA